MIALRLLLWPSAPLKTPVWAVGGTLLVLVGAGVAGPAWLTLALGVLAVAATGAAVRSAGSARSALQFTGMAAAAGTWVSAVRWQGWDAEQTLVLTAVAAAVILAVLAVSVRWLRLGRDWLVVWSPLRGPPAWR